MLQISVLESVNHETSNDFTNYLHILHIFSRFLWENFAANRTKFLHLIRSIETKKHKTKFYNTKENQKPFFQQTKWAHSFAGLSYNEKNRKENIVVYTKPILCIRNGPVVTDFLKSPTTVQNKWLFLRYLGKAIGRRFTETIERISQIRETIHLWPHTNA